MTRLGPRQAARAAALPLALAATLACSSAGVPRRDTGPPALELREGAVVASEVRPGDPHLFTLPLEPGTYFELHLDRPGTEVGAYLFAPGAAADDPYTTGEVPPDRPGQVLWEVVSTPGEHLLQVKAESGSALPYRLTILTLRPATDRDWSRHRGVQVWAEARALQDAGRAEEALEGFHEALELFEKGEYLRGMASSHSGRGKILQALNRPDEAGAEYRHALDLYRRATDARSQAAMHLYLAHLDRQAGRWEPAGQHVEEALVLARSCDAEVVIANALSQRCLLNLETGSYDLAIEFCTEAVSRQRALELHGGSVDGMTNLAAVHRFRGELESARTYLLRALDVLAEHPDRGQEATVRNDLAILLDLEGHYLEALTQYQEALETYEELGSIAAAGTVLSNMGTVHQRLRDLDTALEFYEQALARMEEAGAHLERAEVLLSVGWVHIQKGRLGRAEPVLSEALEIARAAESGPVLALALERWGELRIAGGRPGDAIEALEEALGIYREGGSRWREPAVLVQLARSRKALGEQERALELLFEAAALYEDVGRRREVAETFHRIARLQRDRGDFEAARRAVEQAIAVAESLRPEVGSDELRTLLSAAIRPYYELFIEVLMDQHLRFPGGGHDSEALRESERARARSLLEILPESDLDLRQEVPEELLEERAAIRYRLNAKAIERQQLVDSGKAGDGDLFRMKLELEGLLTELQEVERRIRNASPRYAALTRPEPVTVGEIQRSLLDPETALLEYSLGEERSFLWVVTDREFHSYELPGRQAVEDLARCVHWLITAYGEPPELDDPDAEGARCLGDSLPSYRNPPVGDHILRVRAHRRRMIGESFALRSGELSDVLLRPPALDRLLPFRLAIVSDGALEYVPLAALPAPGGDGEPLAERHEVVRLPSASVLAFQRSQAAPPAPASGTLAIVADPLYDRSDPRIARSPRSGDASPSLPALSGLPFSGREAEAIAAFAPASQTLLLRGAEASRERVTGGALAGYRYVHFATHGKIDTEHPRLSSLVLSLVDPRGNPNEDGYLRLHDIYGLDLEAADLVVLSACETALGREVRGEGLVGLTRGFLYAGAERVVASLWQVQDRATADLMARLYRGLLEEGRSPADALRRAQLATRDAGKDGPAFPYYWAGFVLQGEWR